VYCIVFNTVPYTYTGAYYNFSLDGGSNVSYIHTPDSSSTILYNVQVFTTSGLANVPHKLVIAPFMYNNEITLMDFDYAEYT
jgi:hypothetical protein